MRHLAWDLKYAVRGLLRSPVFTLVTLGSIAIGIGANTAIFALVDEVLLRMMPVKHPEQLVLFTGPRNHYGSNSGGNMLSFPMYEDFRDNFVEHGDEPPLPRVSLPLISQPPTNRIFSGIFCRRPGSVNVGIDGQTERVPAELVSGTYFEVLGVGAAIGRVITPDDDKVRGGSDSMVAVLSYDYWRNRFGADPKVVGQRITINNYPFTIIGVSQAGFDGVDIGYVPSLRVPVMMKAQMTPNWDDMDERRSRWVNVFARLKPGVTIDHAKATLQPFFHGLLEQEVQMPAFRNASAYTRDQFLKGQLDLLPAAQGRSPIRQQLTQPLWLLMGVVAGVLLIACANVASLLIARAAVRGKEIAVRLALGAKRSRIVSQLLVESLLLSMAGGVLGLVVASWTTGFLLRFLPTDTPHVISGAIDYRVLAFNFAVSVATGVLFGLAPALRSTKPDLAPTLKDQVGSVVGGGVRIRKALVVAQVTLSVLLLVGAGLFIRSLRNLQQLDLGLNTDNLIAFNVSPSLSGYTPVRSKLFSNQVAARINSMPGIASVAFANIGLLEGNEWDSSITVEGYAAKPGENMNPYCNAVSPGYFKTMGIPLVAGRDFNERDAIYQPPDPARLAPRDNRWVPPPYRVAIVNERYVKHYFGGRPALGRHIGFGIDPGTKTPIEIVGVVKDAKYTGVRDDIPEQLFVPFLENDFAGGAVIYVRTSQAPSTAFGAIRQALREIDPNVPMYNPRTLEHQVEASLLNERLVATLSTAFGVLATLLAVIGLYGVMAFTVARRTREIGVRMALGAAAADVMWLVMREVLWLVTSGATIGLIAALALSRLVQTQLYGITPHDPSTIVVAAVALGIVAAVAGYIPARRATRVNPVLALRYE
jgi:predicted permease